MMGLDRDEDSAHALIAACMASLPSSLGVTTALLARHPARESSVQDLTRCLAWAKQVQQTGLPPYEGAPVASAANWPTEGDVLNREKFVAFYQDVAARLELSLCVFGTFVSLVARDEGVPPGDLLAEAVAKERARHLVHREGERSHRIATLESAIAGNRRQLEAGSSEPLLRVLAANEAALAKVRALDDVTLCTDRCAF